MTKRSESPGLPKQGAGKDAVSPKPPLSGKPLREYRSRAEREAVIQRYVILGTGVIVALVVVIVLLAFVVDRFITPGQTVAVVNDTTYTVGDFQQRVRLERAIINYRLNDIIASSRDLGPQGEQFLNFALSQEPYSTWLSEIEVPDQLGNRVLNDMIADELVRQEAAERGLTVNEEQIEEQINEFFAFTPDAADETGAEATETPEPTITPTPYVSPTPSPEPTATPVGAAEATAEATLDVTALPTVMPVPTLNATERAEQFATQRDQAFAQITSSAGVSDAELRRYFETQALRAALAREIAGDDAQTTPYVNARHILVATEEEAQDVLAALEAGELFSDLAQAVSTDTGSGANGGVLDWTPVSQFVEPFAEAVREAEIGELVGPVQTEFGYHIIQVLEREEREMTEVEAEAAREEALETYIAEQRQAPENNVETFSIWAQNVPSEPAFIPQ